MKLSIKAQDAFCTFYQIFYLEGDKIVIANSFEDFGNEILKRLIEDEYEIKDGAIKFTDNWVV